MRSSRTPSVSGRARRRQLRERSSASYRVGVQTVRQPHTAGLLSKRLRGGHSNLRLPFTPPEDWHEPHGDGRPYRILIQPPGDGYRHVLTPEAVRQRLAQLPPEFLAGLECVQFSRMTRKKQSFPCYGMQWGSTIYLYPIESSLVETYRCPPKPAQQIEARMYGGRWVHRGGRNWQLEWTAEAICDFYLNNILIHELGHLVDHRNRSFVDRERYAEWFAVHYGYRPTRGRIAPAQLPPAQLPPAQLPPAQLAPA